MASASTIAKHNVTDNAEAASIGARVDSKSGKWYDLKDGHYIGPSEADQRLGRTTEQGNADRSNGNGGGFFDQLAARNQDSVGNLLKNIAPVAGLIPGIGPLIAGGVSALGQSIIPGASLGQDLTSGLQGGAMGAGVGALGSATGLTSGVQGMLGGGSSSAASAPIGLSGMSPADLASVGDATSGAAANTAGADFTGGLTGNALASTANAGGGASLPGASTVQGLLGKLGGGGSSPSNGGGVLGFLTGNNGLNALGVAQGVNAAALGQKSSDYADQAANLATSRWNQQAPLRTAGVAGMLAPQSPFTPPPIPGGNPFAMPQPQAVPPPTPKVGA